MAHLDLQRGAGDKVMIRNGPSSWSWPLVGDRVVVVASRASQRRIQAEQAATVVLGLIPAPN